MAGAREKFDDQPAEPIQSSEPITETEQPKQKTNDKDPVLWTCAIVAMASLAACVILPLWVYFSDKEAYLQNHATFKNALIWPTVIYFITATIWNMKRSKAK
jgi:hypothetical protein